MNNKAVLVFVLLLFPYFQQMPAQSTSRNYIRSVTIKKEAVLTEDNISDLLIGEKQVNISYFDGLGRATQNIIVNGSPLQRDIIQHIEYDDFGRQAKKYLPYTDMEGGNNGKYFPNLDILNMLSEFYLTQNCYSETKFDNSPLNRVTEQIPQGDAARNNNISIKIDYLTNTDNEVILWEVQNNNCINTGNFNAATLYVTQTTDENGHKTKEYKDGLGQVILTASELNGLWLKTYYVYDDFGLLRFVIPPEASKLIENGNTFSDVSNDYCYSYKYDGRKRMIKKKLPGADTVYMVYDKRDLLILTQDGNMRTKDTWMFTKYDAFKRPIITGIMVFDDTYNSQEAMLELYNEVPGSGWETYNDETNMYSNTTFPVLNDAIFDYEIYSETYYDTYDYLQNNPDYAYTDVFDVPASDKTKGMITLSKTYILDYRNTINPEYLLTVNYYDKYGRIIQTIGDNHKDGKDILSNKYNFAGELLETRQEHTVNGSSPLVIKRTTEYDHAGRLLKTFEQINDEETIEITDLTYNEKSELESKKLHSSDGNDFLQEINYQYNIRGWMTFINNPANLGNDFFAMQLKYETGNNPQFNGNISAISWNSTNFNGIKTYEFNYDAVNRLERSDYTPDNRYDTEFTYDYNGNIQTISRKGQRANGTFGIIDNLTLTYDGNRLKTVNDSETAIKQENKFSDRGSRENPDQAEFFYDSNGNMIKDLNKKIENIQYNHLNLPETVEITGNNQTNYIYYTYDAAGIKLRKTAGSTTTDYVGNFVYENGILLYILTDYGRIITNYGTTFKREYNLTDHLGNVRVSFDDNGNVMQEDSYYPFGMTMNGLNFVSGSKSYLKNFYLYNGKELQEDFGLDWYDYGARFYDAQLGRWHVVDPLAEKYTSLSPYHYAGNNPILNVDYDGRLFGRTLSWLFYKFSVNSTAREYKNGNWIVKYNRNNKKRIRNFGGSWFKGRTVPDGYVYAGNLEFSAFGNTVESDDPNSGLVEYFSNLNKKPKLQSGKAEMQPAFFFNLILGVKALGEFIPAKVEKGIVTETIGTEIEIAEGGITRIQNASNRIKKPIHVVGSRAKGSATATSDFDYVITNLRNKEWKKIKNSLPGARSVNDNLKRRIDVFKGTLDKNKPHITINPNGN